MSRRSLPGFWCLSSYWKQPTTGIHAIFALDIAATSSLIFFALSMAVSAVLIMPLGAMLFAFAGSTTSYVLILSALSDTRGVGDLAVPTLVGAISVFIHLSRRAAIRQSEHTRILAERVNAQNLELTTAKRVHDAAVSLAGGVAHHFNNKLQVVIAAIENARQTIDPTHPATRSLDQGLEASETLAQLVTRLQAYAGNLPVHLSRTPVMGLLDLDRIRRLVPAEASIQIIIEATEAKILADTATLNSAVEELVKNAAETIQAGGDLWLNVTTDTTHCHISVADTGTGFDTIEKSHASQPFTSSKPISRAGLGLSYVHGIAERHGGSLRIEDRPVGGSKISISLPLVA